MEHNILTDHSGEKCERYKLMPPEKLLVSECGKKDPLPALAVISFIAVYALLSFYSIGLNDFQPIGLLVPTTMIFPGLMLMLLGGYGLLPSVRKDMGVTGNKERLTAIVEDKY